MSNDLASEAAQMLVPMLSAGADAALEEIARQAGGSVASRVRRILDIIRRALRDETVDEPKVAGAIRAEIEKGTLTEVEVKEVTKVIGRDIHGAQINVRGNAYIGGTINANIFNG